MSDFDDIAQLFDKKDRVLMAAWMLPNKGDLSDAQRKQAMANFKAYITLHGIKVADVAHQLGSPKITVINEMMLKGKFRQNADDHIRKLNMWIEQQARARAASLSDTFVSTAVAKAMLSRARLIRENGTMGLVVGPTGIGKSRCAQAIHEQTVGSIYIRLTHKNKTPKGLISAIAQQLGVRTVTDVTARQHRHHNQYERVVTSLRDSHRLLILDEAQKLTDDALEALRDLFDETAVPMMMIATKDLQDRITNTIGPDHGQQYSRLEIVHHLTQGRDVYAGGKNKPLFTVEEIKALYEQIPIRLSPDATQYLHQVANQLGRGSLRWCKTLLRNGARRARKRTGRAATVRERTRPASASTSSNAGALCVASIPNAPGPVSLAWSLNHRPRSSAARARCGCGPSVMMPRASTGWVTVTSSRPRRCPPSIRATPARRCSCVPGGVIGSAMWSVSTPR